MKLLEPIAVGTMCQSSGLLAIEKYLVTHFAILFSRKFWGSEDEYILDTICT
jgi:hypothetical protein